MLQMRPIKSLGLDQSEKSPISTKTYKKLDI